MRSIILLTVTFAALSWGVISQTATHTRTDDSGTSDAASSEIVAVLVDALQQQNPEISEPAARGLERLGPGATDGLVVLLGTGDRELRVRAAQLLAQVGDRRALSPLAGMYREATDDSERVAAVSGIAAILERTPGASSASVGDAAALIGGIWSSNWGPVTMTVESIDADRRVVIHGSWQQGPGMDGVITTGLFDPDSGILEYSFDEPWHSMSGTARLQMSADSNHLDGTWTFTTGGGGTWTMWRE